MPRSPTPARRANRPRIPSSLWTAVAVTWPVRCDWRENLAVADSPAWIVWNSTRLSERSCAPLTPRGSRLMLTRLASTWAVLVMVAKRS